MSALFHRIVVAFLLCAAMASPALAGDAAFCANRNYVDQTGWTPGVYSQITMPAEVYDIGPGFDSSAWTPVADGEDARVVIFSGQVWIKFIGDVSSRATYTGARNLVVRIIKNGTPVSGITIGAAIATKGPFRNDWNVTISMQDLAKPGDTYRLFLLSKTPTAVMDGHPLHTFWCGAAL